MEPVIETTFNNWCDFVSGWVAGVCGIFVGHPADTVKVRQQTFGNARAGTIILETFKHEGFYGFYKGMSFPLLSTGALNAVFFGVYGTTLRHLQNYHNSKDTGRRTCAEGDPPNKHWHMDVYLAGCAGGLASVPIGCTVDLIKIRLQSQTDAKWGTSYERSCRGPLHCLVDIWRTEGFRGLFRGFHVMLWRDVPTFGLYALTYEHMLSICRDPDDRSAGFSVLRQITAGGCAACVATFSSDIVASGVYMLMYTRGLEASGRPKSVTTIMLAGGLAGITSWAMVIPFDVIKSRIQSDDPLKPKYNGMIDCFIKSYHQEGFQVFGRGFGLVCLRAFPVNAATFVGFEWFYKICSDVDQKWTV